MIVNASMNLLKVDRVIVGGGIIGLSIAERLSRHSQQKILLLESQSTFGTQTSSRNSRVIHGNSFHP